MEPHTETSPYTKPTALLNHSFARRGFEWFSGCRSGSIVAEMLRLKGVLVPGSKSL